MDLLEAAAVRAWAVAARTALEEAADRIDAVNVFPVADSDTGTNVLLTVVGGADAVALVPADAAAQDVARAFARGALLAARGNSGVIVSQYLTGFARALPERAAARDVAHALGGGGPRRPRGDGGAAGGHGAHAGRRRRRRGDDRGRRGRRPADDADGRRSRRLCAPSGGSAPSTPCCARPGCWTPAPARCWSSWTPWRGRSATSGRCTSRSTGCPRRPRTTSRWSRPAVRTRSCCWSAATTASDDGAVVDTGAELRRRMGALGDSVAVVGGDGWWHVHVHTDRPTAAIAAAAVGRREQVLVRLLAGAHAGGSALHDRADGRERWGVVVCTAAPDLAAWYAASGAVVLVRCPEAPIRSEHLERAVTDTGAARVVLLPGTGAQVLDGAVRPGRRRRDARRGRRGAGRRRDACPGRCGADVAGLLGGAVGVGPSRRARRRDSLRPGRDRRGRRSRGCSSCGRGREPDGARARRLGRGRSSTPSSRTWRRTTPASRRRSSDRQGTVRPSCSGWTDRGAEQGDPLPGQRAHARRPARRAGARQARGAQEARRARHRDGRGPAGPLPLAVRRLARGHRHREPGRGAQRLARRPGAQRRGQAGAADGQAARRGARSPTAPARSTW